MKTQYAPITVQVKRGMHPDLHLESQHQVIAVICDSKGKIVTQWGDTDRLVFPRSSAKPLQAMPLILSGAAEALKLNQQQLAMACASHNGEQAHVALVGQWLAQLNYNKDTLECGTHWPMYQPAVIELANSGQQACSLHNNCSGKHCGFLSLAKHHNWPTKNYIKADHAVQQLVNKTLGNIIDENVFDYPVGYDGCSIPTYALPLNALAKGFARFANGNHLPQEYAQATQILYRAMTQNPFYVAGSERECTHIMTAFGDKVACKTGAEGVFAAAIPSLDYGIAIKALDGQERAAATALKYILLDLGLQPKQEGFSPNTALFNRNGFKTGEITALVPTS